jgi:hypothetical protein
MGPQFPGLGDTHAFDLDADIGLDDLEPQAAMYGLHVTAAFAMAARRLSAGRRPTSSSAFS